MFKPVTAKQLAKKHAQIEAKSRAYVAKGCKVENIQRSLWNVDGVLSEVKNGVLFCQLGIGMNPYKWQIQL